MTGLCSHELSSVKIIVYFFKLFIGFQVETGINAGKNVLIHSVQGVSRCATFCLAYIMKAHSKSLKDAYELLKPKRAMVKINEGFWKQLIAFERVRLVPSHHSVSDLS